MCNPSAKPTRSASNSSSSDMLSQWLPGPVALGVVADVLLLSLVALVVVADVTLLGLVALDVVADSCSSAWSGVRWSQLR